MTHTIEDALEILGGTALRAVNIRIDLGEMSLVRSLAQQVHRGTALTDRQIDLSLKKIEKYRVGLTQNGIDVDSLISFKPLRMPVRQIDRTQSISLLTAEDKKIKISIKYVFSKKFIQIWDKIQESLISAQHDQKGEKHLAFNEKDLHTVVTALQPLGFTLGDGVEDLYNEIDKILENPQNFMPYADLEGNRVVVRNANGRCLDYITNSFPEQKDSDFLVFLDRLKNCGIYHKTPSIIEKITQESSNNLVKTILASPETRFRINPEEHGIDTVLDIIDDLNQWPLLVMVDETKEGVDATKRICNSLIARGNVDNVTVFYRLQNGNPDNEQFNQFIKDNHLNNYIDSKTKVVVITKTRIPKPLFNAEWHPRTAMVTSAHDFGKTSAYLNDFSTVYYYNNSVSVRHGKLKGSKQIVQL